LQIGTTTTPEDNAELNSIGEEIIVINFSQRLREMDQEETKLYVLLWNKVLFRAIHLAMKANHST
jgi:hypothetical protein